MSMTGRIMKNAAFQMVSQAVTWVLSWVLIIYLPKYLGDEGFGRLFFAISFATLFSIFINLGINTFLVKEVSRNREKGPRLLANILSFQFVASIIVYGCIVAGVRLMGVTEEAMTATYIIGISFVLAAPGAVFSAYFQGLEKSYIPAAGLIIEKGIVTGLSVLALLNGYGLITVSWIILAGAVTNTGFMGFVLYRQIPFGIACDWKIIKKILVASAPFLIWIVFSEIYIRVDVLMLTAMTGDDVVGWYGAAFRLYATLLFVPNIFVTTVFPALTRKFSKPGEGANLASRRTLNLMLLVSIPIGLGTMMVAGPVIELLYGLGEFAHAMENLQIFGFCIIFVCIDVVLGTILIANEKQKAWSYAAIIAALLNPACNLVLIPMTQRTMGNGGYGAAISTLITEIFMMGAAIKLMPKGIYNYGSVRTAFKATLAGAAMCLAITLLPDMGAVWNLIVRIGAGGVVYLTFALFLRILPKEDTAHMKHAIFRKG
jgi:O-antigen/teichoic acid export membrane protein